MCYSLYIWVKYDFIWHANIDVLRHAATIKYLKFALKPMLNFFSIMTKLSYCGLTEAQNPGPSIFPELTYRGLSTGSWWDYNSTSSSSFRITHSYFLSLLAFGDLLLNIRDGWVQLINLVHEAHIEMSHFEAMSGSFSCTHTQSGL